MLSANDLQFRFSTLTLNSQLTPSNVYRSRA